jgi:hypothetical protein
MPKHDIIEILCDTREQTPLCFVGLDCTVSTATVPVFDYALKGDEHLWSIERKSIPDLVSSLTTKDGQRLERNKIAKAREVFEGRPVIYVIEGRYIDLSDIHNCCCTRNGNEKPWRNCDLCEGMGFVGYDYSRRKISPQFMYRQVAVWQYQLGAQMLFSGCRLNSSCAIENLLRRRYDELKLLAKALETRQRNKKQK